MTLTELVTVICLIAVLTLMAWPASGALRDRAAVRASTTEIAAALTFARRVALAEARPVAVIFDTAAARALVIAPPDTVADHSIGRFHHTTLASTRDSIAFGPTGRGYGGSNTTILIRRNNAADTIIVSREGRVRH
jgi:Tfp pilus assembly protein FimT